VARAVEIKRGGGTRVTRGAGALKEPRDKPKPPLTNGAPAVENREPGLPSISGRAATRVVREAAKVLEKELAAGIGAARRIEERYIDVAQLRSRDPDDVMQRFRRDAHDVVDILMDVLTVVVDSASNAAERSFVLSGKSSTQLRGAASTQKVPSTIPTLAPPEPVKPGQTVEIMISVENDSDKPTAPIDFTCADLLGNDGALIPGANVTCTPNHVVLEPRSTQRIAIQIHVPKATPPGGYCGMFQANNLKAVRAVMTIEVREAE
jgi:hypothetical protein